jgi:hypothetical protein
LYTAVFTVFSCFQGPAISQAIQQLDPCDRSITSGLPFSRQSEPIIRHGDWKLVLEEQREERRKVWAEPLVESEASVDIQPAPRPVRTPGQFQQLYEFVFDHVFLIYGMIDLVQSENCELHQISTAPRADLIQ